MICVHIYISFFLFFYCNRQERRLRRLQRDRFQGLGRPSSSLPGSISTLCFLSSLMPAAKTTFVHPNFRGNDVKHLKNANKKKLLKLNIIYIKVLGSRAPIEAFFL